MATTDIAALSKVLKTLYPQSSMKELLFQVSPLIGLLPKDEEFRGKEQKISARVSPGKGRSATFATAQSNKGPSTYAQFTITTVDDYGLFSVAGKAIRAARGDAASLITDLKRDGDAIKQALVNSMSQAIYGNGGGAIGQILSGSSSEVLTLTTATNMHYFTLGMSIVSDDTDGTSGAADAEAIEITAIDYAARTLTKVAGSDWDASGNFSVSDYLFVEGDFGIKVSGLGAWIPDTAPTSSDSFFGQNRSVATQLLAGTRYVASAAIDGDVTNAFINAASQVSVLGGRPDKIFMNSLDFAKFALQLENRVVYERMEAKLAPGDKSKVKVGYNSIVVMGPMGPMNVVADPWCPKNKAYMLTTSDWTLASMGPLVGWLDEDGVGNVLRESAADAYEGRMGGYFQLYSDFPGGSAVIDLTNVL